MSENTNSGKKPLLDQIKETLQNKDQIREQLVQNFEATKKIVEHQAKDLLSKTKQSKFYNEKVVPFANSELADKAIDTLNTKLKLKDTSLMRQVERLRKEIQDSKVEKAKPVSEVDSSEVKTKTKAKPTA